MLFAQKAFAYFLTKNTMKKAWMAVFLIVALLLPPLSIVQAESGGNVVINEIAWMGTAAGTSDEWIELYNQANQEVNLAGWYIEDDDGAQIYTIASGSIGANAYFLIEDSEESTSVSADSINNLSLGNSGDKLVLKNTAGTVMDTVNSSSGAWYAGDNDEKRTMERIDASKSGDVQENWGNNSGGNGAKNRNDSAMLGTPKSKNSIADAQGSTVSSSVVSLAVDNATPSEGDSVTVSISVKDAVDLFAYGVDLAYDPEVLDFVSAEKGSFLNESGQVDTAFEEGLENDVAGKLIVGEARTMQQKVGVTGEGKLLKAVFQVVGGNGTETVISAGTGSFLADTKGDMNAEFGTVRLSVQASIVNPVQSLSAVEGATRYEIQLAWSAPDGGADSYKIVRKNTSGQYETIGTTAELQYRDHDGVSKGGKLIPYHEYEYEVYAVKASRESASVSVKAKDTRGITGDNNRTDRVDARDLENLARHFTEGVSEGGFDPLIDTTYDGVINGSDLIDIGTNWALTY
ncbi:lamin tail domain-containing protein [Candidatus Peregrinibacteria bacterium]|nr:lamin tail domain-containing protein [Candidatus Peregrinibacteria bacterium]